MKFWLDWEFLEDGLTIMPISIGMVREDGAELYLEVDLAGEEWQRVIEHEWLMANVYPHLTLNKTTLRSRSEMAREIREFTIGPRPEFWGYCAAYDWVCLNQLYGSMVDHPTKWPFYCNDIAQLAEHLGVNRRTQLPPHTGNEHNALDDARWTRDAYYTLTSLAVKGD